MRTRTRDRQLLELRSEQKGAERRSTAVKAELANVRVEREHPGAAARAPEANNTRAQGVPR
jgi:hypothetical protein